MNNPKTFFIPERFAQEGGACSESPRGRLLITSCRSGTYLADRIVQQYRAALESAGADGNLLYLPDVDWRFSDSETCVQLKKTVSGYDVFLIQALYDPLSDRSVDENYTACLIAARTFREYGANHVTAVLPYLGYARQDKPTRFKREPTTAKLMADLTSTAGVDRVVTWHPHSQQISGFYGNLPVDTLPALTHFTKLYKRFTGQDEVIAVAPDAGASKFVTYLARELKINSAIASKYRPRPEEATVSEIIGDFEGKRTALIVDDMISSGGTIEAVIQRLLTISNIKDIYIGVSHNLCMPQAYGRLKALQSEYPVREVTVTNSIPQTAAFLELPYLRRWDLSTTLCHVINRIHYHRSVDTLFEL